MCPKPEINQTAKHLSSIHPNSNHSVNFTISYLTASSALHNFWITEVKKIRKTKWKSTDCWRKPCNLLMIRQWCQVVMLGSKGTKMNKTPNDYRIQINIKKTKVMRVCKSRGKKMKITINGHKVEQVRQFVYLGNAIREDCKCHEEVKHQIAIGKEAFSKRRKLLRRKMKLELKKRIVKTLIWSMVLYAAETWTLRKVDIQRLESFETWIWSETWIWRKLMNICWTEHWSNQEVLDMVDENRSLINTIWQRQKNWLGHVLRSESLLHTVLEGRMEGTRTRGMQIWW